MIAIWAIAFPLLAALTIILIRCGRRDEVTRLYGTFTPEQIAAKQAELDTWAPTKYDTPVNQ